MRIGFYTPSFPGVNGEGGIGTYTRSLARSLVDLGHEVHVLTLGDPRRVERTDGIAIHFARADHFPVIERLLPGSGATYHMSAAMKRLARDYRLDIVEFPNWEGRGLWYAVGRPTPLVVRLSTSSAEARAIDGSSQTLIERCDVRRERRMARAADALVTHSRAHRREMAREIGVDEAKIQVVPLGIETNPTFVRPAEGPTLRVVFLGRLERRKGTLDLLKAIPHVLRSVPGVCFDLIGADRRHCPGGRTHRQWAEEELPPEARGATQFLGRLPDDEVDRRLQAATVVVAPSLYESFGLIFPEAMRWGTPVIGTAVGGIPEVVEHEQSGLLVPPGDPERLALAIVRLLRDPNLRRRLGESGRVRVESLFSTDRMGQQAAGVYANTVGRTGHSHTFRRPV